MSAEQDYVVGIDATAYGLIKVRCSYQLIRQTYSHIKTYTFYYVALKQFAGLRLNYWIKKS